MNEENKVPALVALEFQLGTQTVNEAMYNVHLSDSEENPHKGCSWRMAGTIWLGWSGKSACIGLEPLESTKLSPDSWPLHT